MLTAEQFSVVAQESLRKALPTRTLSQPLAFTETFKNYGLDSLDTMNFLLELEISLNAPLGELDIRTYNSLEKLYTVYAEASA